MGTGGGLAWARQRYVLRDLAGPRMIILEGVGGAGRWLRRVRARWGHDGSWRRAERPAETRDKRVGVHGVRQVDGGRLPAGGRATVELTRGWGKRLGWWRWRRSGRPGVVASVEGIVDRSAIVADAGVGLATDWNGRGSVWGGGRVTARGVTGRRGRRLRRWGATSCLQRDRTLVNVAGMVAAEHPGVVRPAVAAAGAGAAGGKGSTGKDGSRSGAKLTTAPFRAMTYACARVGRYLVGADEAAFARVIRMAIHWGRNVARSRCRGWVRRRGRRIGRNRRR